ncbi:MAG: hypothetical protein KDA37_16250, partial [Planctomycetales bacterium]|nr:hypothetical protein [Planctomycetales bacterium]
FAGLTFDAYILTGTEESSDDLAVPEQHLAEAEQLQNRAGRPRSEVVRLTTLSTPWTCWREKPLFPFSFQERPGTLT